MSALKKLLKQLQKDYPEADKVLVGYTERGQSDPELIVGPKAVRIVPGMSIADAVDKLKET